MASNVYECMFLLDTNKVAGDVKNADKTVRGFNSTTGEQVFFNGAHDDWVQDTVFSTDGALLVSVGRDMSTKLYDVKTQRFIDNVTSITPGAKTSPEIATLKVRYKEPDGSTGQEMSEPILDASNNLERTSPDFRMAAAAAQFAMLLRDSKFKGTAEFDSTARLVPEAGMDDSSGRRAEFIYLVRTADQLKKATNLTAAASH